jgi:iron complex outermembrane recepter protein
VRENKVTQSGTVGADSFYERTDLARVWADAFSGKSRVSEAYAELNMPLVSGQEGINELSANVGVRWASYQNKGGAGTTGESATNDVLNWKFSTVYEPFDFVRLRLTRSRDLRAPGYRDLFLNQPGIPDGSAGNNPWRDRSAFSTENQRERWATVLVGNPDLKNEKSDTTTLGIVLSPGGMAQGMRFSVDYFTINVKDAIVTPFSSLNPIRACWEASGNIEPTFIGDEIDPANPGVNGEFDENAPACREITFGTNPDGSRNLQDVVSHFQARPDNALPIKRRGLDFSWQYSFPMNRVYETLPGSFSLTVRGTRALEASGVQVNYSILNNESNCGARGGYLGANANGTADQNCYIPLDLVGQIRSNTFVPGVTASPTWTGNIISSYRVRSLTTSLAARYVGGAKLDKQWCDPDQAALGSCDWYQDEEGRFLNGSVDRNWLDSYFNFTLNGTYDVPVRNMRQMQVFASINNLFDKTPPFSGGGISGASAGMHDTMGRSYRFGMRMRF